MWSVLAWSVLAWPVLACSVLGWSVLAESVLAWLELAWSVRDSMNANPSTGSTTLNMVAMTSAIAASGAYTLAEATRFTG